MQHINYRIYDQLSAKKDQIESDFGGPLNWLALEGRQACRFGVSIRGGWRDPEEEWQKTHDQLTRAMNRLVSAIKPHLKSLEIEDIAD